jgi:hypothetical protein
LQKRPRFGRIVPQIARFQSACVKFMTAAANVMSGFTNTDCVNVHPQICKSIVEALVAASASLT